MLYESELKVMDLLWEHGDCYASELANLASKMYDWNKNTTYTIIKKLIDKKYIQRVDPKFFCIALVGRDHEQSEATKSLIDRLYQGSIAAFFSHFVTNNDLSNDEIEKLKHLIDEKKE